MSASIWGGTGTPVIVIGNAVDNIAELRALSSALSVSSNGDIIFVAGYTSRGDGGGGNYYLDSADTTSVDNGGSIIVSSDGGRWKLVNTYFMSPKQFGCKGDGATDDTVKFQNFLTALPVRSIGDLVGGNYRLVGPCALANTGVIIQNGKVSLTTELLLISMQSLQEMSVNFIMCIS
jgi:hypothetical protein